MPWVGHQFYEVEGQGFPVVLLHGHTLDGRMWGPLRPLLTHRFRVIVPDLAAHGRSGPAPAGSSQADDVASLLDALAVPKAVVCGHSLGGAVAISFALHFPARCAALVTADAALFGYPFPSWPGPRPYVRLARTQGLSPALEAWLADPIFQHAMASPLADQIRAIVRRYPGDGWLRPAPAHPSSGRPDAERLAEIQAPTLVLMGERDLPDFHAIARFLTDSIPGARQEVVPGAGHLLPMEQPEAMAAALLPFLAPLCGEGGA